MLPLRDIVVFPHMIVPLFVGREKSVRALEEVMKDDKQILLVAQKNAAQDDPGAGRPLQGRHRRHGAAAAEAARRHREGAGRGRHAARASSASRTPTPSSRPTPSPMPRRRAARRARPRRWRAPWSAQFEQYIKLNKKIPPEVLVSINQIDDPAQARRHGRRRISRSRSPRSRSCSRPPASPQRLEKVFAPHGRRDRRPAGREAHPQPRQAADGEDAARVLPERAAQGDPEGARRGRGRQGRGRRARGSASRRPSSPRKRATRRWRS